MQIGKIPKDSSRHSRGFTLIEVIAVLIILGIVSAVVISRNTGTNEAKLQAETDTLKSHLRYAQYQSMNDISSTTGGVVTGTYWGIDVGPTSYTIVRNPASTTLFLPGGSSATHDFSPVTATAWTVMFDEWGSPTITGSPNIGGRSITITPTTGFIQ
jgi:prepilin-type N-terminal cleavage/methylation domain-containing protein